MNFLYSQPANQPWAKYANNADPKWWKDRGLTMSMLVIFAIWLTQSTDGYDKSLTSSIQSMTAWKTAMGKPNSHSLGLINASLSMGGLVFAVPASYIEDWFGRRVGIFFGMVLLLAGSIIQSAANDVGVFTGGRVLVGAGIATAVTCAPILCQEIAHPRMRGQVASLYNVMFNFGALFVTWIAYGTAYLGDNQWAWRIPTIGQNVPCLLVLLALPWIPESPRWLIQKGKVDQAHEILAKYHANGKMDDELVLFELNEIREAVQLEKESRLTWVECFSTPGNRKRFLLLTLVSIVTNWNGKAIVTYYFSSVLKLIGITQQTHVTGFNAGIQVFNLAATLIGAGVCESWGRRRVWLSAFGIMVVANVIQTACSAAYAHHASSGAGIGTLVGVFLYSFGFDFACNPLLFTYEVEIMTLGLRSKGLAWAVTLNNGQGVAISYANSVGLAALGWKFYLVYLALLLVFIVIIYFFFPETSGKTLEEVAVMFDGEDSLLYIRNHAEMDMSAAGVGSAGVGYISQVVGGNDTKVIEKV
ncbi:hypothetical protein BP6252_06648 [Coleophoma cylindrospora]|uniref:Major facilitator superfamily (MFS) profile domain-containing protein n=1 Tax=Coleophoma cylindrospora TaxID=1849047 RepID=A0A3D8RNH8_9HELO|nr:hypothetical protein BP6252_06648 [Coleophoma cylindrospora]